jgi:hypothetical protein
MHYVPKERKVKIVYVDTMEAGSEASPGSRLDNGLIFEALTAFAKKLLVPGPIPPPSSLEHCLPQVNVDLFRKRSEPSGTVYSLSEAPGRAIREEDRIPVILNADIAGLTIPIKNAGESNEEAEARLSKSLVEKFAGISVAQFQQHIIVNHLIETAAKALLYARLRPMCADGQPLAKFKDVLPTTS